MLTGVETAGVVLAVFPLCIELVKLYANGAQTLKGMRDYESELLKLQRRLQMESCIFYNSLYTLFEDTITEEECIRLIRDPKGAEQKLNARLNRPQSVENFIGAVMEMEQELSELQKQFVVLDKRTAERLSTPHTRFTPEEYLKVSWFPSGSTMYCKAT